MNHKLFVSIILLIVAVAAGYLLWSQVEPVSNIVEKPAEESLATPEEDKEVADNIPHTIKAAEASMLGRWQSADDPKSFVQFTEAGSVRHTYDGEPVGEGTWQISEVSHTQPEATDELFLQQIVDGELMEYGLWAVDENELVLNYLARGNTLRYIRIDEDIDLVPPEDWVLYVNDEYGFNMVRPPSWEVQEALKPQQTRALHEIYIQETEYDMWRSDVTVQIFNNEEGLSVTEWWDAWLAEEDQKEAACRAEYGDESPCLYLRDRVEEQKATELAGMEAVQVKIFQFDHTKVCTYVANGEYVYGLCTAGENPNDPNAASHRDTTGQIIESFEFSR